MREVFYNPAFNSILKKEGFVVFPLLDENEINFLLEEHQKIEPVKSEAFYTSIWHHDKNYRVKVNELISSIIPQKLSNVLIDYKPVFANFMVKKAQEKSLLDYHQDWTFVDEIEFIAVNVWIPLVDTNANNGALHVIRGSHRFNIPYRGRNIEGPYWHISNFIRKYFTKMLEVKKGHAVIFDERLIHGSFDNHSLNNRLAVSNVMVPKEAPILHFFKSETGDTIQKMKVEPDFFTRYALNDDITGYTTTESFHYPIRPYSKFRFLKDYFLAQYK